MSTLNEREAILRRALHAAADSFEPRIDGLERIQARLGRPRPLAVAWAEAAWTDVRLRAPAGLQLGLERLASAITVAWERFGPTAPRSGSRASRTLGWIRPVAALGVTVFIVAAGAYVAIDAQQAIFPSSSNSLHSSGGSGNGANSNGGSGTANSKSHSPVGPSGVPTGTRSPNCKPAAKRGPGSGSSSPISQIQSPTSSPSPTTSSSGSASPSPSTTDTSSPAPSSTATGPAGSTTGPTPSTGGVVTNTSVLTQSPAAKASPSPCTKKKITTRNPVVQPNLNVQPQQQVSQTPPPTQQSQTPQTQAVRFGRLNDRG